MNTRVAKLKCEKCGHLCCTVQFIAPIEVIKYVRFVDERGKSKTVPRLRNPITADLDPEFTPEIKIHKDLNQPKWPIRDRLGRFQSTSKKQ